MSTFQPQVFGNYYLLEHIAYGGMAEIYRAKSFGASGFERELVLKRVLERLTETPDFLTMLVNEAKLTATLQHGNIAQVFELGLEDGVYFMTMEYVEGVSLKDLLGALRARRETLSVEEAAYVALQMCRGLDYAHRKTDFMGQPLGIVHCDISPDNAILAFDGNLKVVDFGIARAQASFSNYKEGMVMGKFNYVAPEQAMGRAVDCRADIFSTGIVLYELLTGVHPFGQKGDVDTLIRIARFTKGEVQPPSEVRQEVPEALAAVVMKALANDRGERYASAAHFAEDLAAVLQSTTQAQVHQRLVERIQTLFADRIARRRQVRARDDAAIRELQRQVAEEHAEEHARRRAAASRVVETARPAPSSGRLLWPAAAVLLGAVGFLGGWLGMTRKAPAALFVKSDPPGAEVLLEHASVGRTPLVTEIDGARPYLVTVQTKGYAPYERTFTADGPLVRIDAKLEARLASLEIVSDPPGAEVTVDGVARGATPVSLKVPVGSEPTVKVGLGAATESRTIEVGEGGSVVRFRFAPVEPVRATRPTKSRTRRRR